MEGIDKLPPEIARLIAAKQERRHKLAQLSQFKAILWKIRGGESPNRRRFNR